MLPVRKGDFYILCYGWDIFLLLRLWLSGRLQTSYYKDSKVEVCRGGRSTLNLEVVIS